MPAAPLKSIYPGPLHADTTKLHSLSDVNNAGGGGKVGPRDHLLARAALPGHMSACFLGKSYTAVTS